MSKKPIITRNDEKLMRALRAEVEEEFREYRRAEMRREHERKEELFCAEVTEEDLAEYVALVGEEAEEVEMMRRCFRGNGNSKSGIGYLEKSNGYSESGIGKSENGNGKFESGYGELENSYGLTEKSYGYSEGGNGNWKKEVRERIEEEVLYEMLITAFFRARKHKRHTYDEMSFELLLFENIYGLMRSIIDRTYDPSRSIAFVVFRPVTREIFAAPFRDRVVHHLLFAWCYPWWSRHFIHDSYSCQDGKGTGLAVKRCDQMMRRASKNYHQKTYVVKFDIRAFFMSLPRMGLFSRVSWGLERQFPAGGWVKEMLKFLWFKVLMDNPAKRAVRRGDATNWDDGTGRNRRGQRSLPEGKSLFHQRPGVGIVIGNLTSQLTSNIYLDILDRFMTRDLGFKYYGRYVDDFYVFVSKKEKVRLLRSVALIEGLLNGMGLKLHPHKRYCQEISKGVGFIGARIYPYRILPSERLIKNFREAVMMREAGAKKDETVTSYLGYFKHCKGRKLVERIFREAGWGKDIDKTVMVNYNESSK